MLQDANLNHISQCRNTEEVHMDPSPFIGIVSACQKRVKLVPSLFLPDLFTFLGVTNVLLMFIPLQWHLSNCVPIRHLPREL